MRRETRRTRVEEELPVGVAAPFLRGKGDFGRAAGRAPVDRRQSDERARHQVVVVDAGRKVLHEIELHHRKFIGFGMFSRIRFDARRIGKRFGDEDDDGDSLPQLAVSGEGEIVAGDLPLSISPSFPELFPEDGRRAEGRRHRCRNGAMRRQSQNTDRERQGNRQ